MTDLGLELSLSAGAQAWTPGSLGPTFWIDAARSTLGETAVVNQGGGGSQLNARYGSASGVDISDPQLLTHTGTNYLLVPAVANNYASAPHNSLYRPTSSVSVRFSVSLDAWKPTATTYLGGHYDGSTGQRSYLMAISATSGAPFVNLSVDGATVAGIAASVAPVVNDGDRLAIRADWLAAGPVVRFYTKPVTAAALGDVTSDTGWTQLGTDVTVGVPATLWGATSVMNVAAYSNANGANTKFYASAVKVDGTLQCAADFTTGITSGAQVTFTESSANAATVTINRATTGRKSVAVVRPVWLFGTDDYMAVPYDPYGAYMTATVANGGATSTYASYDTGTATAGAATTLDDSTKTWTVNGYQNRAVRITGGLGVGQVRNIASNTATQLTVSTAWTTTPNATSTYVIESKGNVNDDLEIVARVAMDNWASGLNQPIVAKRATGQYSYYAYIAATGNIALSCSFDGTTVPVTFGSAVAPFTNGTAYWIRIRRTASTGVVTAEYAADQSTEPSTWTLLSSNTLATGTIWQGSANIGVGGVPVTGFCAGKFYTVRVRDGLAGTNVVYWDAAGHTRNGFSYSDGLARSTWTANTSIGVANANPFNFDPTDSFTVVAVFRQWSTPPSFAYIVTKVAGLPGGSNVAGWGLLNHNVNGKTYFTVSDMTAVGTNTAGGATSFAMGDLVVMSAVRDQGIDKVSHYYNNTVAGGPNTDASVGALTNTAEMRIGGTTGAYNDMELLGVAVVPRALTAAEIKMLCTYYGT